MTAVTDIPLLSGSDPDPVEIVNPTSRSRVLLLCEHAGRAIPKALGNLGLGDEVIESHRGWDIGAETVARGIAEWLDAPLVIQNYSRLVIDANRPPDGPHAIPRYVDGIDVPGNANITASDQVRRAAVIFEPMDDAVTELFDTCTRRACFSIHSFTPFWNGKMRPWDVGFLGRRDRETSGALIAAISKRDPQIVMAQDQPYQIDDETDWFIPRHAEPRGAAHSLIEIRNDGIRTPAGCAFWAKTLSDAISEVVENLA